MKTNKIKETIESTGLDNSEIIVLEIVKELITLSVTNSRNNFLCKITHEFSIKRSVDILNNLTQTLDFITKASIYEDIGIEFGYIPEAKKPRMDAWSSNRMKLTSSISPVLSERRSMFENSEISKILNLKDIKMFHKVKSKNTSSKAMINVEKLINSRKSVKKGSIFGSIEQNYQVHKNSLKSKNNNPTFQQIDLSNSRISDSQQLTLDERKELTVYFNEREIENQRKTKIKELREKEKFLEEKNKSKYLENSKIISLDHTGRVVKIKPFVEKEGQIISTGHYIHNKKIKEIKKKIKKKNDSNESTKLLTKDKEIILITSETNTFQPPKLYFQPDPMGIIDPNKGVILKNNRGFIKKGNQFIDENRMSENHFNEILTKINPKKIISNKSDLLVKNVNISTPNFINQTDYNNPNGVLLSENRLTSLFDNSENEVILNKNKKTFNLKTIKVKKKRIFGNNRTQSINYVEKTEGTNLENIKDFQNSSIYDELKNLEQPYIVPQFNSKSKDIIPYPRDISKIKSNGPMSLGKIQRERKATNEISKRSSVDIIDFQRKIH